MVVQKPHDNKFKSLAMDKELISFDTYKNTRTHRPQIDGKPYKRTYSISESKHHCRRNTQITEMNPNVKQRQTLQGCRCKPLTICKDKQQYRKLNPINHTELKA